MDKEELIPIFNEIARRLFSEQEEKHKRKKKYKDFLCCSEEEVEAFINNFEKLLDDKEEVDYEYFLNLFKEQVEEGSDDN